MAAQMYCEPAHIERQGKGAFAAHIRGVTKQAVPLQFPFGLMEKLPQITAAERQALQERMRANHAVHYSELANGMETKQAEDVEVQDPDEPTPYW